MSVTWGSPDWGTPGQNITIAANGSYDGTLERDKGEGRSDDE